MRAFIKAKATGRFLTIDSIHKNMDSVEEEPGNALKHILRVRANLADDESIFEMDALKSYATDLHQIAVTGTSKNIDYSIFLDLVLFYRATIGWFYDVSLTNNPFGELLCITQARQKLAVSVQVDFFTGTTDPSWVIWEQEAFQDGDSYNLSVNEIALLARMSEKSVRNMTHSTLTGPDRLVTIKEGSATRITPKEAMRWLRLRRGYIPCPWELGT